MRKALLVYDGLPVSHGGAHQLSRLPAERVFDYLLRFLDSCTADAGLACALQLYSSVPPGDSARDIKLVHRAAKREFGWSKRRLVASGPNGAKDYVHSWALDSGDLSRAVAWAKQQAQPVVAFLGPALIVSVQARFVLRDPRSGQVLAHQDAAAYGRQDWDGWGHLLGESSLHVRLSQASTWSTILSLPFEDLTDDVRALIDAFQEHLPFSSRGCVGRAGSSTGQAPATTVVRSNFEASPEQAHQPGAPERRRRLQRHRAQVMCRTLGRRRPSLDRRMGVDVGLECSRKSGSAAAGQAGRPRYTTGGTAAARAPIERAVRCSVGILGGLPPHLCHPVRGLSHWSGLVA